MVRAALLIRLLGLKESSEATVTDEEIKTLIAEAESAGVIESGERDMIAGVMRLGDRPVRALMTPLTAIDMLDMDDEPSDIRKKILATPAFAHSRCAAMTRSRSWESSPSRTWPMRCWSAASWNLAALVQTVPVIPESMPALEAMELFRGSSVHMAFVQDEYGRTLGIVTAADLLKAIAGSFEGEPGSEEGAIQRDDGSWLLPGDMAADEMAELIGFTLPPQAPLRDGGGSCHRCVQASALAGPGREDRPVALRGDRPRRTAGGQGAGKPGGRSSPPGSFAQAKLTAVERSDSKQFSFESHFPGLVSAR